MKVKGIRKYARQFLLHIEPKEIPSAIGQMKAVSRLMDDMASFRSFMISPVFSQEEKRKAVAFLSEKAGMTEKVSRYIDYLTEEKAISGLKEIVSSIEEAYLTQKNWAKAEVTAPVPLGKEYEKGLKDSLKGITGREIDLNITVDPSLLGGMRIRIGSTLYDGSIKGQLGLLRDKLIKG
ncbi:MAG: ATP synthase F1 subunit delta [Nitrospirales bacterium]|nr:ATP synthase F1 subunit delta [Nitrospirales bacterium]